MTTEEENAYSSIVEFKKKKEKVYKLDFLLILVLANFAQNTFSLLTIEVFTWVYSEESSGKGSAVVRWSIGLKSNFKIFSGLLIYYSKR